MNAGMNAFQYIHTVKGYIRELEQETGALLKIRELLMSGQEFDDSDLESILDEAGRPVTPSLKSVLRKLDEVDKEIALLKRQSMSKEDQELLETSIELLGNRPATESVYKLVDKIEQDTGAMIEQGYSIKNELDLLKQRLDYVS